MPRPILGVDAGNTSTKFARLSEGTVDILAVVPTHEAPALVAELPLPPLPAVVCSVVATTPALVESLERRTRNSVGLIGFDVPLPLPLHYEPTSSLGPDRVVAAFAAWTEVRSSVLVLDAGTAITLDLVDGAGTFRGGAIAPGFRALASALPRVAPALPSIPVLNDARYPGSSTMECLGVGLNSAARGLIRELLAAAREAAGLAVPLFLTGGDAALVATFVAGAENVSKRPHLLFQGLELAALQAGFG